MSDNPDVSDIEAPTVAHDSNLRGRIARALYGQILHPVPVFDSQPDEVKDAWLADADAVIRELGLMSIPDREFTDQWGHHWEWCGGVTGTWAWRITRMEQR